MDDISNITLATFTSQVIFWHSLDWVNWEAERNKKEAADIRKQ